MGLLIDPISNSPNIMIIIWQTGRNTNEILGVKGLSTLHIITIKVKISIQVFTVRI